MAEDLSGFSMLELFRLEAESQTAILSAGILAIEELQRSPETIESMMRAAHSLKGAARIVGLDPAVRVAHALEDCFVAADKGRFTVRPEHADLLLTATDFLATIARSDDALEPNGSWAQKASALVTDLNTLLTAPAPVAASTVIVSQPARQPPPDPADAPAEPSVFVAATEPAVPETNSGPQVPTANQSAALSAVKNVEQADRVVRVSAESLTRLVGLAGESLVETRQLRPFVDALLNLRATQVELCDTLAVLEDKSKLENAALSASFISMLTRVRERSDECLSSLTKQADNFESFARRNEDLSGRLHHEVIVSRMRPLADGIRGFPRLVRDVARSLDKQVRW